MHYTMKARVYMVYGAWKRNDNTIYRTSSMTIFKVHNRAYVAVAGTSALVIILVAYGSTYASQSI